MKVTHLFIIAIFAIVSLMTSPADAQKKKKSKRFFKQGIAAYTDQDYGTALEAFENAHTAAPDWHVFYHIANCYTQLNQPNKAMNSYQQFIVHGGAEADPQEVAIAHATMDNLKLHSGILMLEVSPFGTTVQIDGETIGEAPFGPILIIPGLHQVTIVRAMGPEHLELNARAQEEVTITADPASGAPTLNITKFAPGSRLTPASGPNAAGLSISTNIEGATVEFDGELAGPVPFKETVTAGEHNIVVRADSHLDYTSTVNLEPGNQHLFDVTLRNEDEKPERLSMPFFIAAGVGALGLVIAVPGLIAYGVRKGKIEDQNKIITDVLNDSGDDMTWEDTCLEAPNPPNFSDDEKTFCYAAWDRKELITKKKRAAGWAITGTVLTVLGGGAAAVLYFKPEWIFRTKSTANITISPLISNNQNGLMLSGQF